jgi:hypothetical protein
MMSLALMPPPARRLGSTLRKAPVACPTLKSKGLS